MPQSQRPTRILPEEKQTATRPEGASSIGPSDHHRRLVNQYRRRLGISAKCAKKIGFTEPRSGSVICSLKSLKTSRDTERRADRE